MDIDIDIHIIIIQWGNKRENMNYIIEFLTSKRHSIMMIYLVDSEI